MPQLPLAGGQPAANFAQRLGPAQLAEQQNSMATNCPQLLNPRACRSALCLRAAVSNPVREMSCKICEKMLHTRFKPGSSSDSLVFANSTYQRLSAFFFPKAISTAELIWTMMIPLTKLAHQVLAAREQPVFPAKRASGDVEARGQHRRRLGAGGHCIQTSGPC